MICPDCLRPIATDADYADIAEGEGEDLCWRPWSNDVCPDPVPHAEALLAIRDELRADVLEVVAGHIRGQTEHLRAAQARNRGEGQRGRDKHRWKLEALTALDQDLRRRWGTNPNPEKP